MTQAEKKFMAQLVMNEAKTLAYMPSFVQQKFGITRRKNQGRCVLSQAAFSISAMVPGLPVSRIVTHVDNWCKSYLTRDITEDGHTLPEILLALNCPINIGGGKAIRVDVELRKHNLMEGMLQDVMAGQPTILVIDRDVCSVLLAEGRAYRDGEVRQTVIRHGRSGFYHCLLAIGIDLSGFVVVRDIRDKYAFKGYAKIGTTVLADGWKHIESFALVIRGVEHTTPHVFEKSYDAYPSTMDLHDIASAVSSGVFKTKPPKISDLDKALTELKEYIPA